jgi:hypothetical protein
MNSDFSPIFAKFFGVEKHLSEMLSALRTEIFRTAELKPSCCVREGGRWNPDTGMLTLLLYGSCTLWVKM